MDTHTPGPHPLSPADRGSLWFLLIVGAAVGLTSIVFSVMRIFEVLLGESIRVTAAFAPAEPVTLGAGDASVPIAIDTATFTMTHLPAGALVAAIAQPALLIVMALGMGGALAVLLRNILRGRVFTRGNTAALVTAWAFGLVGLVPQPVLEWIVASASLDELGLDAAELLAMQFTPFPFIVTLILLAIATHAFSVGTKIQRETEGLV